MRSIKNIYKTEVVMKYEEPKIEVFFFDDKEVIMVSKGGFDGEEYDWLEDNDTSGWL